MPLLVCEHTRLDSVAKNPIKLLNKKGVSLYGHIIFLIFFMLYPQMKAVLDALNQNFHDPKKSITWFHEVL